MWRRWSGLLEALGRIRVGRPGRKDVWVGSANAVDARGDLGWHAFRSTADLHRVWGPVPRSAWEPFHCLTLFAVLDRIPTERIGPTNLSFMPEKNEDGPLSPLPPHARPGASPPPWLDEGTWTILDLPGRAAVKAGVWMVRSGCQPVCTFDNWPHPQGVLKPEEILAELIRWATTVAELRSSLGPASPPLWICDSERLGRRVGRPREFDNRYYMDDSVLPGPTLLSRSGIRRVVYVNSGEREVPIRDLDMYFADLLKAGIEVLHEDLANPERGATPFAMPRTPRRFVRIGYRRSSAGGFGTVVPDPSEGGGGG
jgi:hypothetical protein